MATYNVTTSITNGTIISPTTSPLTVNSGDSVDVQFKGDDSFVFKRMTVNGVSVTPTEVQLSVAPTITVTTTYDTNNGNNSSGVAYRDITCIIDGSTATSWCANGSQQIGKHVQFEFSSPVLLHSFECYSEDSNGRPGNNQRLRVSTDGRTWTTVGNFTNSTTSTFSNIERTVRYVQIYTRLSSSHWLVISEVTMDYTPTETQPALQYTLSNITSNQNVVITFADTANLTTLYFKDSSGTWREGARIFEKKGNCWWELTGQELQDFVATNRLKNAGTLSTHTNDEYLKGRTLLFEDDFNGNSLDTTYWTSEVGYCRNDGAVAYYTPDALSFSDSIMTITGRRTSGLPNASKNGSSWSLTHTSGSIQTQDKFTFLYGRAQAKIKCPKAAGTWPAFWLFGNERKFAEYHTDGTILTENGVPWSECGEVDILEQYGTSNNYEYNLWQSQAGASSSYRNGSYNIDVSQWHIYEVEWTPTTMNFMVDGVSVSGDIDITTSQGLAYRTYQHFLILNLQLGGTAGTVTDDEMQMQVDWVRVYDYLHNILIRYSGNNASKVKLGPSDNIRESSLPTSEEVQQGSIVTHQFFPVIGYKFDTLTFTKDGVDITSSCYHPETKSYTITNIDKDVNINFTTTVDTTGKEYRPLGACPTGYRELVIDENTDISLNGYEINPGHNTDSSSTVLHIELILPTDFVFSATDGNIKVPEEMDFGSGIQSSSANDNYNGVINDAAVIGYSPMWCITNWDNNNYFVVDLPIEVVGTTLESVKTWLGLNNIIIYYKSNQ